MDIREICAKAVLVEIYSISVYAYTALAENKKHCHLTSIVSEVG